MPLQAPNDLTCNQTTPVPDVLTPDNPVAVIDIGCAAVSLELRFNELVA